MRRTTVTSTCFGLAFLSNLAACQRPGSASAASLSSTAQAVEVASASARSRADTDSTNIRLPSDTEPFEAVGYLFPDSSLQIGRYILAFIDLSPPAGLLLRTATTDTWPYKCPGARVMRDTLDLSCPGTPVGTIIVKWTRAKDSDERLPYNGITAMVSVRKNGRVMFSRRVHFRWWEGE